MLLDIGHNIQFNYDDFISDSWVELRIEPLTSSRQVVQSFLLAVGPPCKVSRTQDWCGNSIRHFSIAGFHNKIEVRARSIVRTSSPAVWLNEVGEGVAERGALGPIVDYLEFGGPILPSDALSDLLKSANTRPDMPIGEQVDLIGRRVHEAIAYRQNVTGYNSTTDHALQQGAGVCQDIAQIMIGALRLNGIPARYVNGCLHVAREPGEPAPLAESHAWLDFYTQEHGWVGYDPTGLLLPGERHVVVATARHYDEVPPNKGVYRGSAKETLTAWVTTVEIEDQDISGFRDELQTIRLPVYAESPSRSQISGPEDQEDEGTQQQQQQ